MATMTNVPEVLPEVRHCITVQELVQKDENEVPDSYIWKDTFNYGPINLRAPLAIEIPVIDFSQLISTQGAVSNAELEKLRTALSSWGCFQLINHGMESSFLDEIRKISRQFFNLPMEEKQKYARPEGGVEGYGNDAFLFENQSLDWVDRLALKVTPKEQQNLQYWPENPQSFRNILHQYADLTLDVQNKLLKSIARSISLPEDCFLNRFGKQPKTYARFNYYPRCSRPGLVNGFKPHADGSGITILLQDKQVEGLQVHKDGQWYLVPIMSNALFINLGDQLEIMSNGMLRSPVHRAVTNSERERMTLAMFHSPDDESEIGPVEELVDDKRPRLYKKVTNYSANYFYYFQQGKRPIDAVKSLGD